MGKLNTILPYTTVLKKGEDLWKMMNEEPSEQILTHPSVWRSDTALAEHGWVPKDPKPMDFGGVIGALMEQYGIDIGPGSNRNVRWRHGNSTGPPGSEFPATAGHYSQLYNVENGAIFGLDNVSPAYALEAAKKDRALEETEEDAKGSGAPHEAEEALSIPVIRPVLQQWSDVVYLDWQRLTTDTQRRNLKLILRHNIQNPTTVATMKQIRRKKLLQGVKDTGKFRLKPTDSDTPDFYALLGTPNVSCVAFLLAQHMADDQLGRRVLKSITMHFSGVTLSLMLEIDGVKDVKKEVKKDVKKDVKEDSDE